METLPDYCRDGLFFMSIGLNPSPISVEAGFYFANPRNRFWKALNGSRLVEVPIEPEIEAIESLYEKHNIGFTDLVKKPTSMGNKLRVADYREGAPVLKEKLLQYQPQIAWFQGMGTYKNYLKHAEGIKIDIPWGVQKHMIGKSHVFVTPNPSSANAAFSIDDLIKIYDDMVSFRVRNLFGMG
ncbi:MAG: TDG/mug DNA glycosylase family protein [Gammaproteobacteria bacterium]|jgi:TDG/mug DNA glycosylase family protein